MRCIDSPYTYRAWVYGTYNQYATGVEKSKVYYFGAGIRSYMTNYVKEHGYGWAYILAYPYDGQNNYNANGVWSPDSIGG